MRHATHRSKLSQKWPHLLQKPMQPVFEAW